MGTCSLTLRSERAQLTGLGAGGRRRWLMVQVLAAVWLRYAVLAYSIIERTARVQRVQQHTTAAGSPERKEGERVFRSAAGIYHWSISQSRVRLPSIITRSRRAVWLPFARHILLPGDGEDELDGRVRQEHPRFTILACDDGASHDCTDSTLSYSVTAMRRPARALLAIAPQGHRGTLLAPSPLTSTFHSRCVTGHPHSTFRAGMSFPDLHVQVSRAALWHTCSS